MGQPITILNGSALPDSTMYPIARTLESTFSTRVLMENTRLDLSLAYDPLRRQTNSTALLAQVLAGPKDASGKKIAIVDVDLFIPILTFVFGEAQLKGTAAIVSTHRLADQYYGLPRNDELMIVRLQKELVHELGHTYGLYHCHYFECVMRTSVSVEEIDLKSVRLCPKCSEALMRP